MVSFYHPRFQKLGTSCVSAITCSQAVFTNNSFTKCYWAHVVICFIQWFVSQSGEPRHLLNDEQLSLLRKPLYTQTYTITWKSVNLFEINPIQNKRRLVFTKISDVDEVNFSVYVKKDQQMITLCFLYAINSVFLEDTFLKKNTFLKSNSDLQIALIRRFNALQSDLGHTMSVDSSATCLIVRSIKLTKSRKWECALVTGVNEMIKSR